MLYKKGFFLGEFTLKVIIAVLCLALLAFLFFKLYASFTSNTDVDKARGSLSRINEKVNEAILNGRADYLLLSPEGWILLYSEQGVPSSCQGQKCLCICAADGLSFDKIKACTSSIGSCSAELAGSFASQLAKCNSAGACSKVDKNVTMPEMIKIDKATQVYFINNADANGAKILITKNPA